MRSWNELKRPFREALINAFDENSLATLLEYHCQRRLDRLTASSNPLDKKIDDVLTQAVRDGWLEQLAEGALTENETHTSPVHMKVYSGWK